MKTGIMRIVVAAILLAFAVFVERTWEMSAWQLLFVYLPSYLVAGWRVIAEAAERISHGDIFNEHFLMTMATAGALAIGFMPGAATEFAEAVAVMLFFLAGETFEEYACDRSRKSISSLMELRPDTACVVRGGRLCVVDPSKVNAGDIIVVKPGERVPLDGTVIEGSSSIDTSAITGEPVPCGVSAGDSVVSGCVNISGVLRVEVTKAYAASTVSRIISLVEDAAASKSRSEAFISRFARVYTPVVVALALAVAVIPPLFSGSYAHAFPMWFYRALMFLVVSCPCALVISVPLAFFAGIGGASGRGILVKGSNYMEALARMDTVAFDKTGTLTEGRFEVRSVHSRLGSGDDLLRLATAAEHFSTHPAAVALRRACADADRYEVSSVSEIAGHGVRAEVSHDGVVSTVCVGNSRLMDAVGARWQPCGEAGTVVYVAVDSVYAGCIVVSDLVKRNAGAAVDALKAMGIRRTVMLTGDNGEAAAEVAAFVGVDECRASLLPQDKVAAVEQFIAEKKAGTAVAFVGDGVNDAPVLARADVGVAMGALGSDAAIEAADVVIMDDNPLKIAVAAGIARRTLRIAKENTVTAIGVKVAVLGLAAAGLATMWMAVFADVGVTVIAVLNAMRGLRA